EYAGWIRSVAFSPDGHTVISGSWDRAFTLWDVATGTPVRTFEWNTKDVNSVAYSPDGGSVLSVNSDKTLRLWDVRTGTLVRSFQGHSDSVLSVAFSPDGRTILSGSADATVRLWSLSSESNVLLASRDSEWLALTSAGFFDFGGDTENLLHLVRG